MGTLEHISFASHWLQRWWKGFWVTRENEFEKLANWWKSTPDETRKENFFGEQADLGFQRAGELVGMRSSPNPYTEIFLHSFARFTWSHAHFFSRIVRADRFFPPQKVRVGGGSPIHPSKSFPVLVIGDLDKKKNRVKGPSIKGVHDFRPKTDPPPPLSAVFPLCSIRNIYKSTFGWPPWPMDVLNGSPLSPLLADPPFPWTS